MLLRNFMANARSIKANTTFTTFIHPPDLGSLLIAEGKMASRVKGVAKARPKKNMPISGRMPPLWTASMISAPMKGPVQEKETITVVSAIKNAPIIPPWSALASVLFTRLLGSTISNNPKKERANTKKRMKKRRLGIQWVLSKVPTLGPKIPNEKRAPRRV